MAEHEENFWQQPLPPEHSHAAEAMPNIPPPPPEVKVRTMKSDLESMMKSGGGGLPRFQSIKAPALPMEKPKEKGPGISPRKIMYVSIILIIVCVIGFFVYKIFTASSIETNNTPPPIHKTTPPPVGPPPPPPAPAVLTHQSFLKKPADQVLTFSKKGAAESANDLQTVSQRLTSLVNAGNVTSTFFEVQAKDENGGAMSVNDFLAVLDAQFLDPGFFTAHFVPDFTMFVFKDKNGIWPGYVLSLKSAENWLFLKADVARLEKSSRLSNLFLNYPGDQSPDGFKDTLESSQPARILGFSTPGISIVYGWFHNYLVVSTSEAGLKEALIRL